ncbi:carboxypeptidase regulatory-like domain-containing protein [Candidatus Acetothermia bacterium]|nr:carboxypeptidase regulatory-like domain-containing protein [Candidatus Acetothermia bacterium]MBI3459762.1 carboxypeptidase regulatory-like domain-containing protein [Candidatus Acetothermia bacterium]MBI3659904.1 carboxypeptidase regulatory-like domain-containing protein [Candidatus Acetothermia bacterium]
MRKLLTSILGFVALGVVAGCAPVDYNTDIYGYLEGHVTIGPICPVEREGVPCPVPPEAYAAREIFIYQARGIVARVQISSSGDYWVALRPGRYTVDINKVGMDRSQEVPREIDVSSGKTIRLDIEIDTGIR